MAYHTVWRHRSDSSFVIWLDIYDDYLDETEDYIDFVDAFDRYLKKLQKDNPGLSLPNYNQFERIATKFYIP